MCGRIEISPGTFYTPGSTLHVLTSSKGLRGERMIWGIGSTYNSRVESISTVWTQEFRSSRCILPVRGFIEGGVLFEMPGNEIMHLAGIYKRMEFSLLTMKAYPPVSYYHSRMPILIENIFEYLNGGKIKMKRLIAA